MRDFLYNGLFGKFYDFMMPLLVVSARPVTSSLAQWLSLFAFWSFLVWAMFLFSQETFVQFQPEKAVLPGIVLAFTTIFLFRHKYLLYLLLLALPVKISLWMRNFSPNETFFDVHNRALKVAKSFQKPIQVLDVSTGSCNSLCKHGWQKLDAEFTGIDLSETMLKKAQKVVEKNSMTVQLALGDAQDLPLNSNSFDVVLNYGAVNGMSDPQKALEEMTRVLKPGGLLLFLDEQLYKNSTFLERMYFYKVLSSHDTIHECPIGKLPNNLEAVQVMQIYEFYYICTARKSKDNHR